MQNSTKKVVLVGCSVFGLFGVLAAGVIVWLLISTAESVRNYTTGGYTISGGKVNFYREASGFTPWQSWEIKEADAGTFKILENGYATDKNHAYVDGYVISQSDGKTFKIIRKPYAADQNHVFYGQILLSNSPDKFKIMGGDYSADGEKVFSGDKEFLSGTVDAATFEQVGSSDFFRDKNRVYMNDKIVEGADSATFEPLPEPNADGTDKDFHYAKDKLSVFYQGVKVAGCDPKTHKILDFQTHRDARHLYLLTEKISDDPDNFQKLDADYSKDSANVYWKNKKIGADPATFEVLVVEDSDGFAYAKDAKNVYYCALKSDRADAATFVALKGGYGKDKNNVWYAQHSTEPAFVVENADVATFETYDSGFRNDGRDKNNYFELGKLTKARP
ncbi:MAG: DKNYY domain-containing protein [Actinomycetota bacterium]